MRLMPVEKLALNVAWWAALVAAAFFFHWVAFLACLVVLVNKVLEFKFVYENTRIESEAIHGDDDSGQSYQLDPFPELGTDWERSVRANLSEDEERWNKRILG